MSGLAHLRQSIRDILTTPLGSRVMRPTYGSTLYQLVDAPLNKSTVLAMYTATVVALRYWEPRIRVTRVYAESAAPGEIALVVEGIYLPDGSPVTVDGIQIT